MTGYRMGGMFRFSTGVLLDFYSSQRGCSFTKLFLFIFCLFVVFILLGLLVQYLWLGGGWGVACMSGS